MSEDQRPFPRAERFRDRANLWLDCVESSGDPAACFMTAVAFSAASYSAMLEVWRLIGAGPTADDLLSHSDYEELCCDILSLILQAPVKTSARGPDGGWDLLYEQKFLEGPIAKTFGQCKRYRGAVPVPEVREFLGVIHTQYAVGYFFTSGTLTATGAKLLRANFNIDHNNLCYLVDSERHSAIDCALRRFASAVAPVQPGDSESIPPHLRKLVADLTSIAHRPPVCAAPDGQGTLW